MIIDEFGRPLDEGNTLLPAWVRRAWIHVARGYLKNASDFAASQRVADLRESAGVERGDVVVGSTIAVHLPKRLNRPYDKS